MNINGIVKQYDIVYVNFFSLISNDTWECEHIMSLLLTESGSQSWHCMKN
jgi:hypothetical protein